MNRLNAFLERHLIKKNNNTSEKQESTHTRIPSRTLGLSGGNFHISDEDLPPFYDLYLKAVVLGGCEERLTEKQLFTGGPILIDFDFHYPIETKQRQHTPETISDLVQLYIDILFREILDPSAASETNPISFPVFIMEKDDIVVKKDHVRDGVHLIIGLALDRPHQILLRQRVLAVVADHIDGLPLHPDSSWAEIIDDHVTSGGSPWQLYGSSKPGFDAYKLTRRLEYSIDEFDETGTPIWNVDLRYARAGPNSSEGVGSFDIANDFRLLTAQYTGHARLPIRTSLLQRAESSNSNSGKNGNFTTSGKTASFPHLPVGPAGPAGLVAIVEGNPTSSFDSSLNDTSSIFGDVKIDVSSAEELEATVNGILARHQTNKYVFKSSATSEFVDLQEMHDYLMGLPESYYALDKGTYGKWIRVGWALKNTSSELFPFWLKFSAQAPGFCFSSVPDLLQKWNRSQPSSSTIPLTYKSIRYWCSRDNTECAAEIRNRSIDGHIHAMISHEPNETEIADVLHKMYKDSFVCVDIKLNLWYQFVHNKWKAIDTGTSLRNMISTSVYQRFLKISNSISEKMASSDDDGGGGGDDSLLGSQLKAMNAITKCIHRTCWKNNIMTEAKHVFKDDDFLDNLDANVNLMCFKNGVVDFEAREFRKGKPDDYLSLSTNTNYSPIDRANREEMRVLDEINEFFAQLFPNEQLRNYMWDHLASCLIGTVRQQAINIYMGCGRNGKSKLIDLMNMVLGDYAGTVPVALVTQKRNKVGGTSSEIAQLKGIRYAVMQEPSKGDIINDGVLKQITGGDTINARELYAKAITFVPQFKLVMCTNNLPEIGSTDDGIWRRIRLCKYQSKFTEHPYRDECKEQQPYQFPVDTKIDEKFARWVGVFTARLIEIAFEKQGVVEDCDVVTEESNKYRKDQNVMANFWSNTVRKSDNPKSRIAKQELHEAFKLWHTTHQRPASMPKGQEVYEYADLMCGKFYNGGWWGHVLLQ